jgi:hypothetical protein
MSDPFDIEAIDWDKLAESTEPQAREPEPLPDMQSAINPFIILQLAQANTGPLWWRKRLDPTGSAISLLQACWELVNLQKLAGKPIVDEGKKHLESAIRHLYNTRYSKESDE